MKSYMSQRKAGDPEFLDRVRTVNRGCSQKWRERKRQEKLERVELVRALVEAIMARLASL